MRQFFRLSTDSLVTNMAGNYTGQKFVITPSISETLFVPDVMFVIRTSTADETKFGDIPILTSGIDLFIERETSPGSWTLMQDLVEIPIKSNLDFLDYTDKFQTILSTGGTVVAVQAKLVFDEALRVSGGEKQRLTILIQDDLTGAGTFRATIQRNLFRRK